MVQVDGFCLGPDIATSLGSSFIFSSSARIGCIPVGVTRHDACPGEQRFGHATGREIERACALGGDGRVAIQIERTGHEK